MRSVKPGSWRGGATDRRARARAPVYGDILRFLDDLVRDGRNWPVPLRDRLDAQGAVWWATRPDEGKNGT